MTLRLIGGICMVLSDGRAALLVSSSQQFVKESLTGIWVLGVNNATCCSANHKFRLIYFGRKKWVFIVLGSYFLQFSGEISAFSLDDTNGSLNFVFNQSLFIKNGTEFLDHVGAVRQIHCLSLGGVFAVIWDHKNPEEKSHLNGQVNGTSGGKHKATFNLKFKRFRKVTSTNKMSTSACNV